MNIKIITKSGRLFLATKEGTFSDLMEEIKHKSIFSFLQFDNSAIMISEIESIELIN